ncbi:MAG: AAA family ATPase [Tumebacillaceae bacterium]
MNQWRLHVENFGKIAKATIDVSPFMIFVGKNNSGKSYLMVLLWGILTEAKSLIRKHLKNHPDYKAVVDAIRSSMERNDANGTTMRLGIHEGHQQMLLTMFNTILNSQKDVLLQKVFRHSVSIGKLELSKASYRTLNYEWFSHEDQGELSLAQNSNEKEPIGFIYYEGTEVEENIRNRSDAVIGFVIEDALVKMICEDFYGKTPFVSEEMRKPLYLPASRTGFMHTYRAIVGNLFKSATELVIGANHDASDAGAIIQGAELNLPTVEFLTKLQQRDENAKRQEFYQEELRFLNEEVFQGSVITKDSNQVRFIPRNTDVLLPLHMTSSLVAELAPISLFLGSNYRPRLWIMEEIESHLHSEMQLTVVRLLIRMFNKGNFIWMTTHSDNLAQQINNLITLSQHPMKEQLLAKLGYKEQELFSDLSVIRAYQFETKDGVTEVEQLELGKYGFEMKTFNNTLDRLVRETHLIQNYAGESND